MSGSDAKILDRPEAHPYRIQELMDKLTRGELRVPAFQRRLKWDVKDARVLFDSIYRGYPVGTLLFWQAICVAFDVSEFVFPSPWQIVGSLVEFAGPIAQHACRTFWEIMAGF